MKANVITKKMYTSYETIFGTVFHALSRYNVLTSGQGPPSWPKLLPQSKEKLPTPGNGLDTPSASGKETTYPSEIFVLVYL